MLVVDVTAVASSMIEERASVAGLVVASLSGVVLQVVVAVAELAAVFDADGSMADAELVVVVVSVFAVVLEPLSSTCVPVASLSSSAFFVSEFTLLVGSVRLFGEEQEGVSS